jgi:hypothetical protein
LTPLLSHFQASRLLAARDTGAATVRSSFDLERTVVDVALDDQGARHGSVRVDWASVEHIAESDAVCFALEGGQVAPVRIFSQASDRTFQLWPTQSSPALLISGFLMHRVRDVAPHEGAERMVRALGRLRGRVLDTTSGLGYAAMAAAHSASEVVSIEVEPAVRELARRNPWSQPLFESPKLQLLDGDSAELITTFEPESFAAVVHDPPAINLAGELYSAAFYAALRRVLARRGKLFHYIGDAQSASGGRTTRGVIRRLHEAGFTRVSVVPSAFGVLASD